MMKFHEGPYMEDQNHGLAWTKPNNGIYNT